MGRNQSRWLCTLGLAAAWAGCGGDSHDVKSDVPWADQRTQVIDAEGEVKDVPAVSGDECLDWPGDVCIKPQDVCGAQAADVILDADGKPVDVICYPDEATVTVEQVEAQGGDLKQTENNAVLVLDDAADGADLKGDLSVDANNVVVYGSGPDVSVIEGEVKVDGNNMVVRGVRIQGDVTVEKNDAAFELCVIEGNLTIKGNNTRIVACDVFGEVKIEGNNTKLLNSHFAKDIDDGGKGTVCSDDVHFEDKNVDRMVTDDELGAPISCGGGGKK